MGIREHLGQQRRLRTDVQRSSQRTGTCDLPQTSQLREPGWKDLERELRVEGDTELWLLGCTWATQNPVGST